VLVGLVFSFFLFKSACGEKMLESTKKCEGRRPTPDAAPTTGKTDSTTRHALEKNDVLLVYSRSMDRVTNNDTGSGRHVFSSGHGVV
jgi:hypothetical protein